jgi:hypothetical protein
MYSVDVSMWVKVVTMNFEGAAAMSLQSVDHHVRKANWSELCNWIYDQFSHDQHEIFIRQLFKIKQTTSVQEYIDRFCELVDQLQAYSGHFDPLYHTTRFVDGLKEDIKTVILVQRLRDLDTACCRALLQEEMTTAAPKLF